MTKWLGIIFGMIGAAIRCRHELATETWLSGSSWPLCSINAPDPGSPTQIVSSGSFCRESGRASVLHCTLFSRQLLFAGTVRDFGITGDGKAVTEVVRKLIQKSER